jgi:hypothetical protein
MWGCELKKEARTILFRASFARPDDLAMRICELADVPVCPQDDEDEEWGFELAYQSAAQEALGVQAPWIFDENFRPSMGLAAYLRLVAREGRIRLLTAAEEPDKRVRLMIAESIAVGAIERLPTPKEEPDKEVRRTVARKLYVEWSCFTHVLSRQEEPDKEVRRIVADRISWDRIDRIPSPSEEPDPEIRVHIAKFIPEKRLEKLLTPEAEPDSRVRWQVADRIPRERLSGELSRDDEPDVGVRWVVAYRLGHWWWRAD